MRRLAAILAFDMVGSSRLMEADEVGTVAAFRKHREQLIEPAVSEHHGRIFKLTGDGALAEFGSAVEAVACALAIQEGMAARNEGAAEGRRIDFRVGVHIGDVMIEEEDIYGDGVNVAARLEALAEPGGVCISQQALDHVETKLNLACEDMGDQRLKNITRPIRAYRVRHAAEASGKPPAPSRRRGVFALIGAVVVAAAIAGGAVIWWPRTPPDATEVTEPEQTAPQSDKPSIAVLAFDNLSDDREQEYFADGMAEDIINKLSRISGLFVIARNSSFIYKGRSPDVRDVGSELGVRYVVAGSVRKAGGRIRVNFQLSETSAGSLVQSGSFDRPEQNIFDLQDELSRKIVAALHVTLEPDEETRVEHRLTSSPEAYDLWLQGRRLESFFTAAANRESRRLFAKAIELDPEFTMAYASLGTAWHVARQLDPDVDRGEALRKGVLLIEKAVAIDDELPYVYWALARAVTRGENFDGARAIAALEKATAIDPNYADAHALAGNILTRMGQAEMALEKLATAMRLNPYPPFWYQGEIGTAQYCLTRFEQAAQSLEEAVEQNTNVAWTRRNLIAAYAQLGRDEDARWELEELQAQGYTLSIEGYRASNNVQDPTYRELIIEGLRKAGVPEKAGAPE